MKINSIIDLVKDLDTSRQTKNLNKLLIRILLHLQVEFSSKQRGVIRPLSVVQEWMKDNADLSSRYFLESDELITLNDGLQYTVYNQWGLKQFNKFLEIAQSMYIVNSDKKNNDVIDDIPEHLHKSVLQISKESLQSFVKKKS